MTDWRELLAQAVERLGSVAAVSRELCGATTLRPALSMAINGKYCGDETRLEKLVRHHFERRICPRTGLEIGFEECRRRSTAPKPFGGVAREKHWIVCQSCPHKEES